MPRARLSAIQIATHATDLLGHSTTAKKVTAALKRAGGKVHCHGGEPCVYSIMTEGEDYLATVLGRGNSSVEIFLFRTGTQHTSKQEARDLLAALSGPVSLCDPYLGDHTLDLLAGLGNSGEPVRMLTRLDNISQAKRPGVLRAVKDFLGEYPGSSSVITGSPTYMIGMPSQIAP